MRFETSTSPALCRKILNGLESVSDGWCTLVKLKPTKNEGYVQISYGGANKFVMLQELVLWEGGVTLVDGQQASHLCHKPLCKESHVCAESVAENNARKGCLVWVDCPHCPKKIFVCTHSPRCIKFCLGFNSAQAFIENGIH